MKKFIEEFKAFALRGNVMDIHKSHKVSPLHFRVCRAGKIEAV